MTFRQKNEKGVAKFAQWSPKWWWNCHSEVSAILVTSCKSVANTKLLRTRGLIVSSMHYKQDKKNPKLHLSYQKVLSQFWYHRCGDPNGEANINPDMYNFDKKWLPHWEKHLRRPFSKDVTNHNIKIKRFGLPSRKNTPTKMLRTNVWKPMIGQGPIMGNLGNFGLPSLATWITSHRYSTITNQIPIIIDGNVLKLPFCFLLYLIFWI